MREPDTRGGHSKPSAGNHPPVWSSHESQRAGEGPVKSRSREKTDNISSRYNTRLVVLMWGDYLQATKVQKAEKAIELLECCDPGLRRDHQRNNGGVVLSELPVDAIVAAIKVLAVRIENPTVVRDRLHSMSQDREENVTALGARLRGKAQPHANTASSAHVVQE